MEASLYSKASEMCEQMHVFTHLSHLYPTGTSIYTTYVFRLTPEYDETIRRWRAFKSVISGAIVEHGGTISHQHGVGEDHAPYLMQEKGELGVRVLRGLCAQFDPDGIMNPGKLV
jgi:alkyldihydroxyacetonephosphate synthase